MNAMEKYEIWCNASYVDEQTRAELLALRGNEAEIEERFYKDLEFGTGGLRGMIGAGSNRMNIYTVRRASQGLSDFILQEGAQEKGVVIAYDSRRMSPEFALEAALCFCANGIRTRLFESLRPTPELSFAVRELGCTAGVVVTASHNPPEYNGYKVYWEDGAQITYPKDEQIIACVNRITDYGTVKTMPEAKAKAAGLLTVIGEEIDSRFQEELKKLVLNPQIIREQASSLKIVYTPLHGTGNLPVRRALREAGFTQVYVVPEQELPDGNFPTVSYPNPEDPAAFRLALELARKVDADLVLATDPDADRLGVYAKDSKTGVYMPFTGNMSGIAVCAYRLSQMKEKGILPGGGAVVTTIVSGNMARAVAKEYGADLIETLTGFKYIGEQIKLFERDGSHTYLFGFEESYGCLVGTHARDKDAVSAVLALCEAAAYCRSKGKTLWDEMQELFARYGYYCEGLHTLTMKGIEGAAKIQALMETLRQNPPAQVGGWRVLEFRDYAKGEILSLADGSRRPAGLPKSNVLYFDMEEDAWCCVRPSGTEPKIKFYMGVKGSGSRDAAEKLAALKEAVLALIPGEEAQEWHF